MQSKPTKAKNNFRVTESTEWLLFLDLIYQCYSHYLLLAATNNPNSYRSFARAMKVFKHCVAIKSSEDLEKK